VPASASRLQQHFRELCQPRNPIRHHQAHQETRSYLKQQLEQMGRTVRTQSFSTEILDIFGTPVEGLNLLGEALQESTLIVVAHYDTVDHSPGADDNLSAVVVALEIAARCPSVHILFPDLEEFGLLGARHFVSARKWSGLSALVLESVGYWNREDGAQSYPEIFPLAFPQQFQWLQDRGCRGDFLALLHLPQDRALADSLQSCLGPDSVSLEVPAALLQREEGKPLRDFGRSDHLAFWEQGRSCLMLTDSANFRNPHYHQPTDTPETLDLEAMSDLVDRLCDWCLSFTVG
jgi:Zn-dependent M28 family amino/carboxypeptidase